MFKSVKAGRRRTLFSRLVTILAWLTLTIVALFTAATLIITYSFEDVLFHERLQQAHTKVKNGDVLPYNIRLIGALNELEPDLMQQLRFLEFGNNNEYGEFRFDKRHYHYLVTEEGTILYDTTDVSIVDRALEDVFLILGILLIPTIILTLWVAKLSARYALKPFTQLTQLFVGQHDVALQNSEIDTIKEQDVKHIALELQRALQQKADLLEQQMIFNQGMAHELRTPLQVMRNSVELLAEKQQGLATTPAFLRLEKSMNRMARLSNGLLWLTSEQEFSDRINVAETVNKVLLQLDDLSKAHSVTVYFEVIGSTNAAVPTEVLELIVFNLFNNVVHHGQVTQDGIDWNIELCDHELRFSNLVAAQSVLEINEQHFGIGLNLVTRLAERFDLTVSYTKNKGHFLTTLTFP